MRHYTIGCTALVFSLSFITSSFAQVINAVTIGTSRQVRIAKTGNKTDVLKTELLNFNICPTRSTLDVLEALNPQLRRDSTIDQGTSLVLPFFTDVNADIEKQIKGFLTQDNAVSSTANALLLENSRALQRIISGWLKEYERRDSWVNDLRSINSLLQKVVMGKKPRLRKFHTDILNSEIKRLADYLAEHLRKPSVSFDTAYVHSFKNYFYKVVGPYYVLGSFTGSWQHPRRNSGLAAVTVLASNLKMDPPDPASAAIDVRIHVLIPVLVQSKYKYIDSMNQYWVYCLSEFQFDNLNQNFMNMSPAEKRAIGVDKLNTLVTVDDLEKTKGLCPSPASITAKRIDTRFPYHFIVVSLDKKNILIHDWIDLKKYTFEVNDGQYGLGLYQNIHWSQ